MCITIPADRSAVLAALVCAAFVGVAAHVVDENVRRGAIGPRGEHAEPPATPFERPSLAPQYAYQGPTVRGQVVSFGYVRHPPRDLLRTAAPRRGGVRLRCSLV
jgi:hypothetical protein